MPAAPEDHARRSGSRGPCTNCMRSSTVASGLSIRCTVASMTSREVVRRDVGGHADRDAAAAVDQQVREPRREHDRLLGAAVVGRLTVDGVLVDLAEQLHRQRREPRLGVAAAPRAGRWGRASRSSRARRSAGSAARSPGPCARARRRSPVAVRVVVAHHVADRRSPTSGAGGRAACPRSYMP